MTTQHPEALRLAAELDDGYPLTGDAISAAAELRRQHARITELESQLAQRFDAADVATDSVQEARASHGQAPAEVSPTAGMNIPQRILHVGGRNNDAGYVEFGSIQAVEALVRQVLRDLPALAQADSVPPPAEATNTKTHELLSTTVGLLMGYREGAARQPYKPGSVIAKVVYEVVDHLKDWPYLEPIPPAQTADSVLEDAARYRYLRDGDWREHEKLESVIRLQLNALWDETIDAARKQGEKQ